MSEQKRIAALDGDGVILDYNRAYPWAWKKAFGVDPKELQPTAFWATERWDVSIVKGEELAKLRAAFDEEHWTSIPAMPGAVEACIALHQAGYEVVCVTALSHQWKNARLANLKSHGFPIDRVVTCESEEDGINPKLAAIEELKPALFVEDFYPYLRGMPATVHRALINRDPLGSPNVGRMPEVDSMHSSLEECVRWWLAQDRR